MAVKPDPKGGVSGDTNPEDESHNWVAEDQAEQGGNDRSHNQGRPHPVQRAKHQVLTFLVPAFLTAFLAPDFRPVFLAEVDFLGGAFFAPVAFLLAVFLTRVVPLAASASSRARRAASSSPRAVQVDGLGIVPGAQRGVDLAIGYVRTETSTSNRDRLSCRVLADLTAAGGGASPSTAPGRRLTEEG